MPKILLGGVFVLASIFIVGVFFIYGYMARLARNVIAGVDHPLPEWDDLGEFFSEGLRIFGVILVYVMPVAILSVILVVPAAMVGGADSDMTRSLGGGAMTCISCLIFPIALALAVWLPAALLMAAVRGTFAAAFDFSHIASFIKANVANYAIAFLIWLIARMAGGMAGVMLLCIGLIFTQFWAWCIATYAFAQTYRLSPVK